jgi:maltooligosyltrehalose trehalohydrolase
MTDFAWTDQSWTGRELPGSVIYALHVGAFTPEGTFDAVIGRLDHLVDLGIDLIELLAVNAVPGGPGWGNEGVDRYAPCEAYGGSAGLRRLVDAAHCRGLGVLLDIVYDQAGLAAAYSPDGGPYVAGAAAGWRWPVDLDRPYAAPEARRYLVDSVLTWLRDYHADGLRLDGVPAMADHRVDQIRDELAAAVDQIAAHLGRPLSVIVGSDLDDPQLLSSQAAGVCLPPGAPAPGSGHLTGEPWVPGRRLVAYPAHQDRGGDSATGNGHAATSPGLLRVGATLLLTAPVTPMLFMGEEWGATTPWASLTGQSGSELATAVINGKGRAALAHDRAEAVVPVRAGPDAVARFRLDWAELDKPDHREILDLYRRLIALRRSRPDLSDPTPDQVHVRYGSGFIVVRRGRCFVAANLAAKSQRITLPEVVRSVLLATRAGSTVMRDAVELPAESAVVVAA